MKVPLTDWAARHYCPAPDIRTVRAWVRAGEIYPPPEKVGRCYYVDQTAKRITDQLPSLVERIG